MGVTLAKVNIGIASIVKTRADGTIRRFPLIVGESQVEVETVPLDLGSPRRDKYIDAIVLEIENADSFVDARVFVKQLDRIKDEDWVDYDSGHDLASAADPIFVRLQTRYVQLKIIDAFPNCRWKLSAISFYGQPLRGRL